MVALTPEVISWLAANEENFVARLSPQVLELMSPGTIDFILAEYPDALDAELATRLEGIAQGEIEVFVPETTVTRTDGNSSVTISVFKDGGSNTVVVAERIFEVLDRYEADNSDIDATLVFEHPLRPALSAPVKCQHVKTFFTQVCDSFIQFFNVFCPPVQQEYGAFARGGNGMPAGKPQADAVLCFDNPAMWVCRGRVIFGTGDIHGANRLRAGRWSNECRKLKRSSI